MIAKEIIDSYKSKLQQLIWQINQLETKWDKLDQHGDRFYEQQQISETLEKLQKEKKEIEECLSLEGTT